MRLRLWRRFRIAPGYPANWGEAKEGKMSTDEGEADVTGRDRHVILKALTIAIEALSTVPKERQPFSDRCDMKKLLQAMVTNDVELAMYQASAYWALQGKTWTPGAKP